MKTASRWDWRRLLGLLSLVGAAGLIVLLLVLPLIVLAARGFMMQGWRGLADAGVFGALSLSLMTTLVTAGMTLALGTPLAYILARWRFPLKGLLAVVVQLPIVLPPAVAGLALLLTFGRRGFLGSALLEVGISLPFTTAAVVLAQFFVSAPFFIRTAQVGFESIPREVEEAARVDGADGLTLFSWITLPLASRALAAGLVLSWARALGEFGATILFAGSLPGRTQTMPLLIYSVFERDINAAIWTGIVLVGLALVALMLSQRLMRSSDRPSLF